MSVLDTSCNAFQDLSICSYNNLLIREVIDKYSRVFKIKYVKGDYTLIEEDFNGFTIIIVQNTSPCQITVPKLTTKCVPVGRCLTIIQDTDNSCTLVSKDPEVSYKPRDANTIRREGGVLSIIYEGKNKWRLIGELP